SSLTQFESPATLLLLTGLIGISLPTIAADSDSGTDHTGGDNNARRETEREPAQARAESKSAQPKQRPERNVAARRAMILPQASEHLNPEGQKEQQADEAQFRGKLQVFAVRMRVMNFVIILRLRGLGGGGVSRILDEIPAVVAVLRDKAAGPDAQHRVAADHLKRGGPDPHPARQPEFARRTQLCRAPEAENNRLPLVIYNRRGHQHRQQHSPDEAPFTLQPQLFEDERER